MPISIAPSNSLWFTSSVISPLKSPHIMHTSPTHHQHTTHWCIHFWCIHFWHQTVHTAYLGKIGRTKNRGYFTELHCILLDMSPDKTCDMLYLDSCPIEYSGVIYVSPYSIRTVRIMPVIPS
jgi:hypothetical protein